MLYNKITIYLIFDKALENIIDKKFVSLKCIV
jgi:hypothetical protein